MQQNPPHNLIMPRNPAAVQVPNGTLPGMGARPGMPAQNPMAMSQPQDSMSIYRSFVESGQSSQTSTIRWEQYGQGGAYDQGLQEIANNSGPDQDSLAYLASQVVQANIMFIQHIMSRTGKFFEVYRQTLESFRRNEQGQPCGVRDAFVTMFSRHHEFNRPTAINASPLFGWRLINIKRETGSEELSMNQYLQAAEIAIRSILFFEMVNWMMKTPEGQVHARALPRDLAAKMPNLDKFIETMSVACSAFNVNNNYAGLVFEVKTPVRSDVQNLRYESGADYLYGKVTVGAPGADMGELADVYSMIQRNARDYRGEPTGFHDNTIQPLHPQEQNWNSVRNDLDKLTQKNKAEFRLNRFFHNIGKTNHFVITETDWKQIKHAFKKHPEMGQEQTVQPGCFRIVIIDLENDTGWFSTLVRSEALDMPTVLTDPSKLLPLLENVDGSNVMTVAAYPSKNLTKENKPLEIELNAFNALDVALPVVSVKEPVISHSSKEFESTLSTVNQRLTGRIRSTNAVSFTGTVWDTFACAAASDKELLFKELPFLFKDSTLEAQPSLFEACKKMLTFFKQERVDNEVCLFIDQTLTKMFNDYLVNAGGYDPFSHQPNSLNVDSLIKDYDDLDQHLQRTDEMMFHLFNHRGKPHYLTESLKLFTYHHPFSNAGEELNAIEQIKQEQELVLQRDLSVTFVNHKGGPSYTEANAPIVMKRSIFPEYFDVIEKGFELTMGTRNIEVVDKLICFTQNSENLWLFSYSAIDKNMATLRHVSRRAPLALLSLD